MFRSLRPVGPLSIRGHERGALAGSTGPLWDMGPVLVVETCEWRFVTL